MLGVVSCFLLVRLLLPTVRFFSTLEVLLDEGTRESEVAGSNPGGHDVWLTGGGLLGLFFYIFFARIRDFWKIDS